MATKVAYKAKLKPGAAAEYKRRHEEVWPEVLTVLRENGVSDYSIFLDEETSTLFGVYTTSLEPAELYKALLQSEITQKWWSKMAELVEFKEDQTPDNHPLKMVFHMD